LQTIKISRQHEGVNRECKPPRHDLQQLQELRLGAIRRGTTAPINVTIPYMATSRFGTPMCKGRLIKTRLTCSSLLARIFVICRSKRERLI
jgi:hypothetical protein